MKGQNTLKMQFLFNTLYIYIYTYLLIHFPLKMILMYVEESKTSAKNFPEFMYNPQKKRRWLHM